MKIVKFLCHQYHKRFISIDNYFTYFMKCTKESRKENKHLFFFFFKFFLDSVMTHLPYLYNIGRDPNTIWSDSCRRNTGYGPELQIDTQGPVSLNLWSAKWQGHCQRQFGTEHKRHIPRTEIKIHDPIGKQTLAAVGRRDYPGQAPATDSVFTKPFRLNYCTDNNLESFEKIFMQHIHKERQWIHLILRTLLAPRP